MNDAAADVERSEREVRRFLHHEAQLIDQRRFEDWLALFADDGYYWIPSRPGQTDPKTIPSIIYENRPLLEIRVRRLLHPKAHAVLPTPRTLHVVGNMEILDQDPARDEWRVTSNLLVVEHQDSQKRLFAGYCEHRLRPADGGFKIALKRVDLIDSDAVHGIMNIPL